MGRPPGIKPYQKEIETLETELLNNFYYYYNYGPYIKEYFWDIISTPIN